LYSSFITAAEMDFLAATGVGKFPRRK
jgi:hypothetical protein